MITSDSTEEKAAVVWLHLSDFHANDGEDEKREKREKQEKQALVTRALVSKLKLLPNEFHGDARSRFWPIDFVVFSGDLADAGAAKEYAYVRRFLSDLGEALHLPPERFIIVPGNHDVDRDQSVSGLELAMADDRAASAIFRNAKLLGYLQGKFLEFSALNTPYTNCLNASTDRFSTHVMHIGSLSLGFVLANTAWLCQSRDYPGRLLVDSEGLKKTLEEFHLVNPDLKFVFLVMHHAPSWLHVDESKMVTRLLGSQHGVDAVILGHDHRLDPRIIDASGEALYLKSGALFGPQSGGSQDNSESKCILCRCVPESGLVEVLPLVRTNSVKQWCFDLEALSWAEGGIPSFISRRRTGWSLEGLASTETARPEILVDSVSSRTEKVGVIYMPGPNDALRRIRSVTYKCVAGDVSGEMINHVWTNSTWETRFSQSFPIIGKVSFSVDIVYVDGTKAPDLPCHYEPAAGH